MNLERLKMLEEFLREEPGDPFNAYALALEYLTFDPPKASVLFETLLNEHPDYVPVYYQAGNLYYETGFPERAIAVLQTGLQKARAASDLKAAGEIQGLLDAFC